MNASPTRISRNCTGEMRLRVLCTKKAGPNRSPDILVETAFDAKSKLRVCIRTIQSFQHNDVADLKIQVCRVSQDGRWVDTARAVPFADFRTLVVDQWVFSRVRRGLLKCFFQPIVDSREPNNPKIYGHEALIRCPLPGDLTLNANDLFSLAYTPKLCRELHTAALWCCLRGSSQIRGAGKLFINIDPGHVNTGGGFWTRVQNLLNENEVSPADVVFEIVEARQLRDLAIIQLFCQNARTAGFQVALDDFGAQTDPFQLLLAMRPDYIKLESTLVRGCLDDPWRRCIAENLISLARKLSIHCVVEGVEDELELTWAKQQRTPLIQGYRYGRPSPDPILLIDDKTAVPQRPFFKGVVFPALANAQPFAENL